MQGAITETSVDKKIAESRLVLSGDTLSFIVEKDIQNVKKITASLAYNEEAIQLIEAKSNFGDLEKNTEELSQDIILTASSPTAITQ